MNDIVSVILDCVSVMTVSKEEILGRGRSAQVVAGRIIVAKLLSEFTCFSEKDIADLLHKDRMTVWYYITYFDDRYKMDKGFAFMYDAVKCAVKKSML